MNKTKLSKTWFAIACILLFNSIYLLGFGDATLFYVANVGLHFLLGLAIIPIGIKFIARQLMESKGRPLYWIFLSGTLLFALTTLTGLAIVYFENIRPHRYLLIAHIIAGFGAAFLMALWLRTTGFFETIKKYSLRLVILSLFAIIIVAAFETLRENPQYLVQNPGLPPAEMEGEAMGGSEGPFFPSAAETKDGKLIPAKFFLDSQSCGRSGCHPDIVEQWESSAHRFSSFNNQWYRKSIEYMQEVVGETSPQWCAGCHDPALLFSGQMKQKVQDFIDTPEAHAGLACVSCHNIVHIKDTMGNGGYVIEYPDLHDYAVSENKLIRTVHDFLLRLDPEPHRRAFLKPFHTRQTAEFCASCHKVHLDVPVNNYRWVRGFNTYDNWQASGVSGQGARSFYYPPAAMDCADCHMPLVPSKDAGNINGMVHDHRFAAANTALPTANQDTTQLKLTAAFLKRRQITLDIFAISKTTPLLPLAEQTARGANEQGGNLTSTFAVGEEAGFSVGSGGVAVETAEIIAPLKDGMAVAQKGESLRLDVVTRTRGVGHFFPSGTVDAQEAWLEVKAVDSRGKTIFWSGAVADSGKGPVDPSAHFYRNILLDARGNPINKRNAWAARSVLYVNLIPPGAADVSHYRLNIPGDCGDEIKIVAKLNYRKFTWWNTHFAYAGERDPMQADHEVTPHYDDGNWVFTGDTRTVSGKLKEIPALPIITMATDTLTIRLGELDDSPENTLADRERWNDYGIGLLRQGALKGAEQAFRMVTEVEPGYVDGWINLSRVYLREGNLPLAEAVLDSAEKVQAGFHKTFFFRGLLYKTRGEYQEALANLKAAAEQYPKDRVVQNQIGRVYYLNAQPQEAIPYFEEVLKIDSEDLMAHYNLMLCYRAVGNAEKSKAHEIRYLRYKEDENAKAIAQEYRRSHPHDNNESQPIHEHGSMMGF